MGSILTHEGDSNNTSSQEAPDLCAVAPLLRDQLCITRGVDRRGRLCQATGSFTRLSLQASGARRLTALKIRATT